MNHVPAKDRDIAMVFQSYALYPHMTVHANMAFGLRRRGTPRHEIDGRVRTTAELLAHPYLERKPHALSGGQRSGWRSAAPSSATPRCSCRRAALQSRPPRFASRPGLS
jgi:ABC-type sugar transport system ATPase subunit